MTDYQPMLDELLRVTQVVRKNMLANEGGALLRNALEDAGVQDTPDARERIVAPIFPWIAGDLSIIDPLITILQRYADGGAATGQDIYNLLYIIHFQDRGLILKACECYGNQHVQHLPKPHIRMILEGGL